MEALIAQDGTIFNWHNIVSVKETMDGILAGLVVDGYVRLGTYDNADTRKSVMTALMLAINDGRKTFVFPQ